MKKVLFILGAAALVLASCAKSETVVKEAAPGEMTFKVVSNPATKADASFSGVSLKNTWGIYAAATQKNSQGVIENQNFFSATEQLFATAGDDPTGAGTTTAVADSRIWQASPAVYWPLGGVRMDFLAYAMIKTEHDAALAGDWKVDFDNASSDVASLFTVKDVDTYAHQRDFLYAAANDQTSAANSVSPSANTKSVALTFKHAQALLIFNVKASVADKIQIDEIAYYTDTRVSDMTAHARWEAKKAADGFDSMTDGQKATWNTANPEPTLNTLAAADVKLETVGTFTVDNSKIDLEAKWSDKSTDESNYKMPNFNLKDTNTDGINDAIDGGAVSAANTGISALAAYTLPVTNTSEYAQLGETLLIPQQTKVKFTMTYTIGGKTYYYTHNDLKGTWEMGKKYIYNIDIQLHEIYITETVTNWVDAAVPEIPLS